MFDRVVSHVLKAQVALYHACTRLRARTDGEALHDLRIKLRRLRSLLRPLRGIDSVERLDSVIAQLGKLTTPVRDLEVLVDELESKHYSELAAVRRSKLAAAYDRVLRSRTLAMLFEELDEWPASFRLEQVAGDAQKLGKKVTRRLERQISRLTEALGETGGDRHKLRILAKHTRYMIEAYPQQSGVNPEVMRSLKTVLSALGAWHDLFQWCLKAGTEKDLQPLLPQWQQASVSALRDAEGEIIRLRCLLAI
jgi:CHAD domain-containing protein